MADDPSGGPRRDGGSGSGLAAVIAAAVLVAAPFAGNFEGLVPKAAPDPAGIETYCFGETQDVVPDQIYTRDQCTAKLRLRLARDYGPRLLKCAPALALPARRNVFAAFLDASYNAGWAAVCKSPGIAALNAGAGLKACDRLPGWYVTARAHFSRPASIMTAKGWRWNGKAWVKTLPGLVRRRAAEAALCRTPVA